MYEMAVAMSECIYPAIIEVNKNGHISALVNHEEIINRSQVAVKELSQYFEGEIAETCLSIFKKHCSSPEIIIKAIRDDIFFRLLFLPVCTQYNEMLIANVDASCILNGKEIFFDTVAQMINKTNENKIPIAINGTNNNSKNILSAYYQLYPEDNTVFSIKGFAEYLINDNSNTRIEFELYHINTEERKIFHKTKFKTDQAISGSNSESIIMDESEIQIKKKNWTLFN
jgi:hypothetical protein